MKKMLSFTFATDEAFQILVGSISEYFPNLSRRRVSHLLVEMYTATMKVRLSITRGSCGSCGSCGCCWSFCSRILVNSIIV